MADEIKEFVVKAKEAVKTLERDCAIDTLQQALTIIEQLQKKIKDYEDEFDHWNITPGEIETYEAQFKRLQARHDALVGLLEAAKTAVEFVIKLPPRGTGAFERLNSKIDQALKDNK